MEEAIGRYLLPQEVVHHKDGNKQNNELSNLVLFANNGEHLAVDLHGKVPKWTSEGLEKIRNRKVPSMKGTDRLPIKRGALAYRKKLIQKFLHETSNLENIGPVASLPPLPLSQSQRKKVREKASQASNAARLSKKSRQTDPE
jgi:hypothetical protein